MKSKFNNLVILFSILISYILCQEEEANKLQVIEKKNFRDSLLSGFSLIFISEIGDKTFFLTMIFAASNSFFKTLFLTAITMLSMNAMSLIIGYSLPFLIYREYIDWIAIFVFLIFGIIMLYQGLKMESKYIDEEFQEVVREVRSRSSSLMKVSEIVDIENQDLKENILEENTKEETPSKSTSSNALTATAYITSLIVAELGDRSQITAIVIGAINNFYGVLLGTSLAFLICIMTAIFFGNFLKKVLTTKELTLIGSCVFLLFSLLYFLEKVYLM
jgi:putative Ca2+/H+ antiporter (TMEM165/GDT1 family)